MRTGKYTIAITLMGLLAASAAYGATQSVTANIKFDTPLSLTKNNDIQFGTVKARQAGTYVINTSSNVTASSGGVWLFGIPAAGSIAVTGSTTNTVTISTGNYIANNGVTPSAATCKYGTGAAASCDSGISGAAPGASTPLLVGVQVVADGTQAPGSTAAPSFTVSVVYN